MDYILKSRGKGKTSDLIRRSAKTKERILTSNGGQATYINEKAKTMGLEMPKAMFYMHYDPNRFPGERVLIDEVKPLLKQLLKCDVGAVTDTPNNVVLDIVDLSDDPDCYMKNSCRMKFLQEEDKKPTSKFCDVDNYEFGNMLQSFSRLDCNEISKYASEVTKALEEAADRLQK